MPVWKKLRVVFCVLVVFTILFRISGMHAYNIRTSSMAPGIPAGSLAVVVPTEPISLEKGDIAAYQAWDHDGPVTVIHRVVRNDVPNGELTFRGDANQENDPEVDYGAVVGEMLFSVPYVGFLSGFLLGGTWLAALFCGGVAAWIFRRLMREHLD